MSERRRRGTPRRTARGGLPVQGARPPRRPATPPYRRRGLFVGLALVVVALTAGLAARRVVVAGYFEVGTPAVTGVAMVTPDAVVQASGEGPIFQLYLQEQAIRDYRDTLHADAARWNRFCHAMIGHGIYFNGGKVYCSAAHTKEDHRATLTACEEALNDLDS